MIKLIATAALLLPLPTQCVGPAPEPPTTRPACQGEVVLRQHWDDLPLNCDMNPPQILAVRIDEMQSDYDRCRDSGGRILYDDEVYAIYCINIDY